MQVKYPIINAVYPAESRISDFNDGILHLPLYMAPLL